MDEIKFAVEAILFASERPLSYSDIQEAFGKENRENDIREALEALKDDYRSQNRGFMLAEIAGGYQLVTDPRFAEILRAFYQNREKKRLSPASMETLSVIAYKQPVTKVDIEFVRGVNVDGPLKTLLDKNMIKVVGKKEVPGRPLLYGTTKEFLDRFGLKSVKDLPPLSQFTERDIDSDLLPPEMKTQGPQEGTGPSEEGPEPERDNNGAVCLPSEGPKEGEPLSDQEGQKT